MNIGKKKRRGFLAVLAALLLTGCGTAQTADKVYPAGDLTTAFSWLHKATYELGDAANYLNEEEQRIPLRGTLFGTALSGNAYLTEDRATKDLVVTGLSFTDADTPFSDWEEILTGYYGEPYRQDEEGYVEANGGANIFRCFDTGTGTLRLSKASEQDYTVLEYTSERPVQEEAAPEPISVDDVTETFLWLGQTAEEAFGADEGLKEDSVSFTGALFGNEVKGTAYLTEPASRGEVVWIVIYEVPLANGDESFAEVSETFSERYGPPIDEGLEPYAEANGGEVTWYLFDAGTGLLRIAKGSERDYYTLEIQE